jgi:hypothetical protein
MIKYLITSGCSFTDNHLNSKRWPHFLSDITGLFLYNRGQGSAGNNWISKSIIYQIQILLNLGVFPKEILVITMWSGIDRKDLFISSCEDNMFNKLLNDDQSNPINFLDDTPNVSSNTNKIDGYLLGAATCKFNNIKINSFKQELILKYFSNEALAIESYEHFLRLQWFCESKGIICINQTYKDIMHYPDYTDQILTKDCYRNIKHLYELIDFDKWIFWKDNKGLYEYTKDVSNMFGDDKFHPSEEGHRHYVINYLIPTLKQKNIHI